MVAGPQALEAGRPGRSPVEGEPEEGERTPSEIMGNLVLVAIMLFATIEAVNLLGFEVEYRPNPQNVYLTTGSDNLALHQSGIVPGVLVNGVLAEFDRLVEGLFRRIEVLVLKRYLA